MVCREPADLERAKTLCGGCPLRRNAWPPPSSGQNPGACGGEILVGGVVIGRKRSRGRPRKEVRRSCFGFAANVPAQARRSRGSASAISRTGTWQSSWQGDRDVGGDYPQRHRQAHREVHLPSHLQLLWRALHVLGSVLLQPLSGVVEHRYLDQFDVLRQHLVDGLDRELFPFWTKPIFSMVSSNSSIAVQRQADHHAHLHGQAVGQRCRRRSR